MSTLSEMIMRHGPPIGDVVEHHKREAELWRQRYEALAESVAKNAFMHAHPPVMLMAEPDSFNNGKEYAERRMLQLFTDPENQPTQHGTVTVEYMRREIAAERKKVRAAMKKAFRRLVGLVRADEREACAYLCERMARRINSLDIRTAALEMAAENIRARGNA